MSMEKQVGTSKNDSPEPNRGSKLYDLYENLAQENVYDFKSFSSYSPPAR